MYVNTGTLSHKKYVNCVYFTLLTLSIHWHLLNYKYTNISIPVSSAFVYMRVPIR